MSDPLKLNLGCGSQMLPGWLNVDKFGAPDLVCDLEATPWPWPDNSVEEVLLSHVLEHLGRDPGVFIAIMKELYRVCRANARVKIVVPHPRHDSFLMDPTHVRPVLPGTLEMFSRKANLEWQGSKAANTPLALYHDVDFEIVSSTSLLDEPYRSLFRDGKLATDQLQEMERSLNNVVLQVEIALKVVK
jgi:hypothetical protein